MVYLRPVEFDIGHREAIVSMIMDHFSVQGSVEHHLCAVCVHAHTGRERRRKEGGRGERGRERREKFLTHVNNCDLYRSVCLNAVFRPKTDNSY